MNTVEILIPLQTSTRTVRSLSYVAGCLGLQVHVVAGYAPFGPIVTYAAGSACQSASVRIRRVLF